MTHIPRPEADLDLDGPEELVPVILAYPSPIGQVVSSEFAVTTTTLLAAQNLLANGSQMDPGALRDAAADVIGCHLADRDLASDIAAQLVEAGLIGR